MSEQLIEINLHQVNPKQDPPDWLIENIAEASRHAAKIYIVLIAFLFYCFIAAIGIKDIDLVTNNTIHLPVININVSIDVFYIYTPIISIGLFCYLQLYLHRLIGLKNGLINYKRIRRRLYPWMINIADDSEEGFIGTLQKIIVSISLWWLFPFVMIIITVSKIRAHDYFWSYLLSSLTLIISILVIFFWMKYKQKNKFNLSNNPTKKLFIKYSGMIGLALIIIIFEISIIRYIIPYSHEGLENYKHSIFKYFCLNLHDEMFINNEKMNYYKANEQKYNLQRYQLLWANYAESHFEGANLQSSIFKNVLLKKAKFNNAILINIDLSGADLSNADLSNADLTGANLYWADLSRANLTKANLSGANLTKANLSGANLTGANFTKATLTDVKLTGASLYGTDLTGAYFSEAMR